MIDESIKTAVMHLQCELVAERNLVNPEELSWLQYDILSRLSQVDHMLPSELCILLGISRVKLAKSLKKLKQQHYIVQNRSDDDSRSLLTKISPKGTNFLKGIYIKHNDLAQIVGNTMSQEEQTIFIQLSNRLSEALRSRRVKYEKSD